MLTINALTLRKNLYSILENVIIYGEPITVTTKNGNAVIISENDYNSLKESLYLSKNIGKIKKGEKEDIKKMSKYNPKKKW